MKICRFYDIEAYPSLKFFPVHIVKNHTGLTYSGDRELEDLQIAMINYVSKTFQKSKSWPRLIPLRSIEDIWKERREEHEHVALIFEDKSSYIGREVILDLSSCNNILVRRMTKSSVKQYGIREFPSLYLVNQDGTFKRLVQNKLDRPSFTQALKELAGLSKPKFEDNASELDILNQGDTIRRANVTVLRKQDCRVHMQDLESTLHYSFRQEISVHKIINDTALSALKQFINILAKYFPGRDHVRNYLWNIKSWLDDVKLYITGEQWFEKIDVLQTTDAYLPEKVIWNGCKGTESKYRGYPCGLWTLFHTLTVSSYMSGKQNPRVAPKEVLYGIAGYMKNFFGCEECRRNFLLMVKTVDSEVTTLPESVLWLWQAHNKANKRLHGDISEDPKHPKVQFPPANLCPGCRKDSTDENSQEWNIPNVLTFVVSLYREDKILLDAFSNNTTANIVSSKDNELDWWETKRRKMDLDKLKELKNRKIKRKEQLKNSLDLNVQRLTQHEYSRIERSYKIENISKASIFNHIDLGMCVAFYIFSTVIILFLYYHFTVRRNMKICGLCAV